MAKKINEKKQNTRKILADANVEDLAGALNNCTDIATDTKAMQDSLHAMICKIEAGKIKANLTKIKAAYAANIEFMNKLGPALNQCNPANNFKTWTNEPCKGPCSWDVEEVYMVESECLKNIRAVFEINSKTQTACFEKIKGSPELVKLVRDAIIKDCPNNIDDELGKYENYFDKFCDSHRYALMYCLSETPCVGNDEVLINKLLALTPKSDVGKIREALLKQGMLDRLIGAIDGDNFEKFITTLSAPQFSGTRPSFGSESFIFNGSDALPFEINDNGVINLKSRRNFTLDYYQNKTFNSFQWITVIFMDDFRWNNTNYKRGEMKVMTGLELWALFNQSDRNKSKIVQSAVLDLGLTMVGVGAVKRIKDLPKIYRIIATAKAGVDVATGLGGFVMALGLEDELQNTPEGQEVLAYWTWFNLVYGTASLGYEGVAALYRNADVLLAKSEQLSAGMKAWLPKLKEKLEALAKTKGWKLDIKEIIDIKTLNSSLAGKLHPITKVPFYEKYVEYSGKLYKGVFPKFESLYTFKLPKAKYLDSDPKQFSYATTKLYEQISKTPELAKKFTLKQLENIKNGASKISDLTWHHNEEEGVMELVDFTIHNGTNHTGGRQIWGGGSEYR